VAPIDIFVAAPEEQNTHSSFIAVGAYLLLYMQRQRHFYLKVPFCTRMRNIVNYPTGHSTQPVLLKRNSPAKGQKNVKKDVTTIVLFDILYVWDNIPVQNLQMSRNADEYLPF